MKRFAPILAAALVAAPMACALADDIDEQVQRGLKAYADKNYRGAIHELQFAISQIQEKLNAQYVTLLPEPLAGWQADNAEAQTTPAALFGGGTTLSRHYHKAGGEQARGEQARGEQTGGEQQVNIEILADSPMIQALSMFIMNPAMMTSEPGTRPYHYQQYKGILKHEKDKKGGEINLIVANRILVKVTGENLPDDKPLEDYLKAIDFKKMEALMGP